MTPRRTGRTETCSEGDARSRLERAEKFLEVADLAATEADDPSAVSVATSLAVLAGIAAADAASCAALGRRSRSQNHHDAENLLSQIEPDGEAMRNSLRRLVDLKDKAHYGLISVSPTELRGALRQARALAVFARRQIAR